MSKLWSLINNHKFEYKDGDFIYFLMDNDEIVYIGRTIKIFPPVSNHGDKKFTHVSMPPITSFDFNGGIEELYYHLVITLKPKYNTTLPPNERYMRKSVMKKRFDVDGHELNRLIRKNGAQPVYLDYFDIRDVFKYDIY